MLGDIGRCAAPCVEWVSQKGHQTLANNLVTFLQKSPEDISTRVENEMKAASEAQEYEKAAKLRPEGRAAFLRSKRTDQKKSGDAKKGGNRTKGKTPTFSKTGASESKINEIPMADLQKIDQFADKQLNPLDVVITDKHFFDRLNDPRNGKEISQAELIGFFKRLGKNKKQFLDFLDKYQEMVAVDDRTNINIPFMKQANKAIAKTIMRKKDFKSFAPKLDI